MKRSIALVLCLLLCLSAFAGCTKKESSGSGSSKKKTIVGTWELDMSIADVLEAGGYDMDELGISFTPKTKISGITLKFTEDGEITGKLSADKIYDALEDFLDELLDYLRDGGIYEMLEAEGMSKEDVDKTLAENGMTVDSMIEMMADQADLTDMSNDLADLFDDVFDGVIEDDDGNITAKQVYKVEDGMLYVAEDEDRLDELDEDMAVEYKLSGDSLSITIGGDKYTFERAD